MFSWLYLIKLKYMKKSIQIIFFFTIRNYLQNKLDKQILLISIAMRILFVNIKDWFDSRYIWTYRWFFFIFLFFFMLHGYDKVDDIFSIKLPLGLKEDFE